MLTVLEQHAAHRASTEVRSYGESKHPAKMENSRMDLSKRACAPHCVCASPPRCAISPPEFMQRCLRGQCDCVCRACKCTADGGRSFQLCVGQLASAAAARVQREQHAYDQVASRVGMESCARNQRLLKPPHFACFGRVGRGDDLAIRVTPAHYLSGSVLAAALDGDCRLVGGRKSLALRRS